MPWTTSTDPQGRTYYFNSDTGASQWTRPADFGTAPQKPSPAQPPRVADTKVEIEVDEDNTGGGSAFQKINLFLASKACGGSHGCCAGFARCLEPDEGPLTNAVITRAFWGGLFYGILFIPFVFALLQQTMIDHKAIDPFNPNDYVSASAWCSGFIFLFSISAYCLVAFTAMPESWYEPGSMRLSILFLAVVAAIVMQQALTFRYISLRPELSKLQKNRSRKYKLCGNVYSTANPRNISNYIQFSVVLAEFFLMASVAFHPTMPWRQSGSRTVDEGMLAGLEGALQEFLVGRIYGLQVTAIVILLLVVFFYLLLLGDLVYQKRSPTSVGAAIVCDFIGGSCFSVIVGRLIWLANRLENFDERSAAGNRILRFLCLLAVFMFATTAVFVAVLRVNVQQDAIKKNQAGADIRFKPKYLATERIMKGLVGIFAALLTPSLTVDGNNGNGNDSPLVAPPPPPLYRWASSSPRSITAAEFSRNRYQVMFIIFAMIIVTTHLHLLKRWKPTCSVTFVMRTRRLLLKVALYGQFIALCMILIPWENWLILLVTGWSCAAFGLMVFGIYKVFCAEPPANEASVVRRAREKDAKKPPTAADKIIRHARGSIAAVVKVAIGDTQPPPPPPNVQRAAPPPPRPAPAAPRIVAMQGY